LKSERQRSYAPPLERLPALLGLADAERCVKRGDLKEALKGSYLIGVKSCKFASATMVNVCT